MQNGYLFHKRVMLFLMREFQACRRAVKFGDPLSMMQMARLHMCAFVSVGRGAGLLFSCSPYSLSGHKQCGLEGESQKAKPWLELKNAGQQCCK